MIEQGSCNDFSAQNFQNDVWRYMNFGKNRREWILGHYIKRLVVPTLRIFYEDCIKIFRIWFWPSSKKLWAYKKFWMARVESATLCSRRPIHRMMPNKTRAKIIILKTPKYSSNGKGLDSKILKIKKLKIILAIRKLILK